MKQALIPSGGHAPLHLEQKLALLIMNTHEPIVLIDFDFTILAFNASFRQQYAVYFGTEIEKGQSILNYAKTIASEDLQHLYDQVFKGAVREQTISIAISGQETSTFLLRFKPAYDEDGKIFGACVTSTEITEKIRAEAKLARSEQRFKQAQSIAHIGNWEVNFETKMSIWSDESYRIYGLEPGEHKLSVDDWLSFVHPADKERVLLDIKKSQESLSDSSMYHRIIRKDGAVRYVNSESRYEFNAEGIPVGLYGIVHDITERVTAEGERTKSLQLLEKLTAKVPLAVYQFEMDAEGNMSFPFMSPAITNLFPGIDVEQIKQDAAQIFASVDKEDLEKLITSIQESRLNLTDWDLEFRAIGDNGELIWLKGSSRPEKKEGGTVIWYGYLQDITERKLSEVDLKIAKERYDLVAKATNEAIWDWDIINDVIHWGEGFKNLFGQAEQEVNISLDSWISRVHPEHRNEVRSSIMLVIHSKTFNQWQNEYSYEKSDGSYAEVLDRGFVIRDNSGNAVRMIGAMQDITDHKRANERIRIAKERYDLVAKATNDAIYDWDLIKNEVIRTGDGLKNLFGYSHQDVCADKDFWRNRVHPDDLEAAYHRLENYLVDSEKDICSYEYRFRKADGTYAYVFDKGYIIRDEQGKAMRLIGATQDITHRKESEERHRKLFQFSPLPMWVYDPDTLKFLDVNEAAVEHYGYSREEFLKMSIRDIRPETEMKLLEKVVSLSKIKGGAYDGVFSHYKKDGTAINVHVRSNSLDFNGKNARLVLASDITEKVRAEEALRLSEQRFKSLVQEGSDLIVILDMKGNYNYVSPTSISILGMNPGKLLGQNVFDFIHDEDKKRVMQQYNLLKFKKQVHIPAFRFKTDNQNYRWLETVVTNLMDDPSINGLVANSKDVSQRYAYEEKLTRQESLFRKMIEKSSDMKALLTKEGVISFGTVSITRLFGYEQDEYIGMNIGTLVHPEDATAFFNEMNAMISMKQQAFTITLRLRNKAGQYLWCEKTFTNLLEDADVNAIVCNFRDVTENKEALHQINESNERYNLVAKATSDAIWDYDAVRNRTFVSGSGYKHLFGYPVVNDFTDEGFWESCLHPDEKDRVVNEIYKAILNEDMQQYSLEYRMLKADGTYAYVRDRFFIMRENGKVVRMIGAKQDITRHKEEEERLKLLESFIVNATDAAIITDAHSLDHPGPKIVFVNDAFIKMTGYSREEIIGQSPRMFQGAGTDRKKLDEIRQALENQQVCEAEIVNYTKDGRPYWSEMSIAPITDLLGKATHFIAIQRDITNRKMQEQEREKLIQELTQNNIDLRQFSYITSHNLRGPIASLLGLCTLLDNFTIKDGTLVQILAGIKKATYMFDETIRDLATVLNIRDRTSIPREDILFFSVFEKSMAQLGPLIDESEAEVESDFGRAPVVNYNKAYLESIFSNLITNSIKYRSPERKLKVSITTETVNDHIVMKFKDNGLGLDIVAHREKIFRLHQRFHNHAEGKGLGLFLIKSQVESLNGTIDVESKEGEGATFTLKFKK